MSNDKKPKSVSLPRDTIVRVINGRTSTIPFNPKSEADKGSKPKGNTSQTGSDNK